MTNANAESSKTPEIVCLSCNVKENKIEVINGGRKDFSLFEVERDAKPHIIETKNGEKVRYEVNAKGERTKRWAQKDVATVHKITDNRNSNAEHNIA